MVKSIVKGYTTKVVNTNKYYKDKKGFISCSATILVENWYGGLNVLWEWLYLESYPNVVWRSIRVPENVSYNNPTWPAVPFIKCGDIIDLYEKKTGVISISKKRKDNMFFDSILDDKLGGEKVLLGG